MSQLPTSSATPSIAVPQSSITLAKAIPSFNDRRLTPQQAIERRRKQSERQRELRKKKRTKNEESQKEDEITIVSSSMESDSVSSSSIISDREGNTDTSISVPTSRSSSSSESLSDIKVNEAQLIPDFVSSSTSILYHEENKDASDSFPSGVVPVHQMTCRRDLRRWAQQCLSFPIFHRRAIIEHTVKFAPPSFIAALEKSSGFIFPSISTFSDEVVDFILLFALKKTPWRSTFGPAAKLATIAEGIVIMVFFGLFGCQCMCVGQLRNTDCPRFHRGGRCQWVASVDGAWKQLTIDHKPALKQGNNAGFQICGASHRSFKREISSWRWVCESKINGPFKCISCNTIVSSEEADSDEENENIE